MKSVHELENDIRYWEQQIREAQGKLADRTRELIRAKQEEMENKHK